MVSDSQIQQAKTVDILSLIPTEMKKVSTTNEWAGACPFCGGVDRFRVWPSSGRWWCRQCDKKGDVIDLVMELKQVPFAEAVEILSGEDLPAIDRKPVKKEFEPTHSQWERRAREFAEYAMDHLDPDGLAYLATRGLDRITAFGAGLGWNPDPVVDEGGKRWGVEGDVYLAPGLVIPYEYANRIHAINIRAKEGYRIVKGSVLRHHGARVIYRPVPWPAKNKVVLFEGEFDALAAWQALGSGDIGVGSIPAGNLTSLDQLGDRECWVCFDTDEAGIAAASAAEAMGTSVINLPKEYKDYNAFLLAVGDAAAGAFLLEAIKHG